MLFIYSMHPRGLLVDYHDHKQVNDFTKELVSEIKRQGGIELKIDPYLEKRRLDNNGKAVENGGQ
jgi:lipid II:glycine glycyltransferase (peptidoglycan interpeptide bridge formation enzyme)